MTKKKQPVSKSAGMKMKAARRMPGGAVQRQSAIARCTAEYLCAGSGPVARWPDGNPGSVPYRSITRFVVTTDADGWGALFVNPSTIEDLYATGVFTSGSLTSLNNPVDAADTASLQASFRHFRVNAACIHLAYIHNNLENEGRLSVKKWVNNQNLGITTAGLPTTYGTRGPIEFYTPLKHGACVCLTPADSSAHDFKPTDNSKWTNSEAVYSSMYSAGIFFEGKASKTVLEVTIVQDLELIAELSDFTSRLHTPGAPANPKAQAVLENAAKDIVASGASVSTHHEPGVFAKKIAGAIRDTSSVVSVAKEHQSVFQDIWGAITGAWSYISPVLQAGASVLPFFV